MSSSSSGLSTFQRSFTTGERGLPPRENADTRLAAPSSPTVISVMRGRWFCG